MQELQKIQIKRKIHHSLTKHAAEPALTPVLQGAQNLQRKTIRKARLPKKLKRRRRIAKKETKEGETKEGETKEGETKEGEKDTKSKGLGCSQSGSPLGFGFLSIFAFLSFLGFSRNRLQV
jgi:hypothetical protein